MKKVNLIVKRGFKFTALFISLCCFSIANCQADTVLNISTGYYPPWTGEQLKQGGFVNHVITEVYKRQGYQVKFSYLPWKRSFESTKQGKFHATSYWYKNAERALEFYYSKPLNSEKLVFFFLKDNPMPDWKSLDDLKGYKIGATRGYTYTEDFWQAAETKRINVQVVTSDLQNLGKLLKGRIDFFLTTLLSGYTLIQKEISPESAALFTFHPRPLSEKNGHLLFPKNRLGSVELLQVFNQGLAKIKKEGLYTKLVDDLLSGEYSKK
ncbi:MAG: transporter substrate-binding domain-containing protein [Pseudomonadales bacterium]|nr:transporter substrate-binding domain-containing protein [Pseudomonadales bacterium]NRA16705.1 amino acid ABC transporter substrate-binding protein [Oceanospirillaceae bacterium]